jgi:hypothetical protein
MSENSSDSLRFESPEQENVRLREENARLQRLLAAHSIAIPQLTHESPPSAKAVEAVRPVDKEERARKRITLFRSLFRGREDVYARRWESDDGRHGYVPAAVKDWKAIRESRPEDRKKVDQKTRRFLPLTDAVIESHLLGKETVGVYPLLPDETCWFLAADFDKKTWEYDALAFLETCQELSVPAALERSRSGEGGHIWIFFERAVPAIIARKLGCVLLTQTMERRHQVGLDSYDRFFPNQDTMPKGGFGNLIALPLQLAPRKSGNSVFIDSDFRPYPDQWQFISTIRRMPIDRAEEIVSKAQRKGDLIGVRMSITDDEEAQDPRTLPPSGKRKERPIAGTLPATVQVVRSNLVYDNQPDFSFLAPYETRTFSQHWYPIREIGPPRMANLEGAIGVQAEKSAAHIGVAVSRPHRNAVVRLEDRGKRLARWRADLAPAAPFVRKIKLPNRSHTPGLNVIVEGDDGVELIRCAPEPDAGKAPPAAAVEPHLPAEISGVDQLFWTGVHLEQYRHATRRPEDYWREALRRDPGDSRCNNALGRWHLRRGELTDAATRFRTAIDRITERNPNPECGEPYYNLGVTLRYMGRNQESYDALYKATWNHACRSSAYLALAESDACAARWSMTLEHVQLALRLDADNLNARDLAVIALRKLGRRQEAESLLYETLRLDPLHSWSRHLSDGSLPRDEQMRIWHSIIFAPASSRKPRISCGPAESRR